MAVVLAASAAVGLAVASLAAADERVVHITARRFEFEPSRITLKRGEAVRLDLESADRLHGFSVPGLGIRTEIPPGQVVSIRLTSTVAGSFAFICDSFCGVGHDDMDGRIIVTE